jgi:hypothetical protein
MRARRRESPRATTRVGHFERLAAENGALRVENAELRDENGALLQGFVLCLIDFHTGARCGELVGQQRHEYDAEKRAIGPGSR